jgi:hypothetical protein
MSETQRLIIAIKAYQHNYEQEDHVCCDSRRTDAMNKKIMRMIKGQSDKIRPLADADIAFHFPRAAIQHHIRIFRLLISRDARIILSVQEKGATDIWICVDTEIDRFESNQSYIEIYTHLFQKKVPN